VEALIDQLRMSWWALVPDATMRHLVQTAVFFGFYYVVAAFLERLSRARNEGTYESSGFQHDVFYYFYFKGGFGRILVPVAIATWLEEPLSFLSVNLLHGLPFWAQVVGWLLVADLTEYWVHRARHHFRFFWAFHTTHHSQTHLNFATYTRVHPVEDFTGLFVGVFLSLLLGVSPITGLLLWLLLDAIGELNHSRIAWRFGPLRWIFVTPHFHSFHHSIDPAHHDRNFGVIFSVWDRLFGTAVPDSAPAPVRFGLADVKPTTLWSTIVAPFELLVQFYGPRPEHAPSPLADEPRSQVR
jgi:sterol desaturase/sphingolipid hydroxylase (fatty acid hydroxylase superfamily)